MRTALYSAPDYAGHSAAPEPRSTTTVQSIILSAQCGVLKDFAALCSIAAFIVAAAICIPG